MRCLKATTIKPLQHKKHKLMVHYLVNCVSLVFNMQNRDIAYHGYTSFLLFRIGRYNFSIKILHIKE